MTGPAAVIRDRVSVLGFKVAWATMRALPEAAAYAMFDRIADATRARNATGVRRLRSNYARVRPELTPRLLEDLVRDGMRSYMRYYCDSFRLPDWGAVRLGNVVRTVGDEPVRAHLATGRSVVVFVAHMGNWDTAGGWATGHLAKVTTVAERLEPEEVFREFLDFREGLGMTILPLTGGEDPFLGLRRAAQRGEFIALVADRDLTHNGVEVTFCGQRARMAKGPAVLAITTGIPLYAASIRYEPATRAEGAIGGHRLVIEFSDEISPPATGSAGDKVVAMTQACADHIGSAVTRYTADWHMLQRVFIDDLDQARLAEERAGRAGRDGEAS